MGKEKQPFGIIRTIFVDSFDIAAEKTAQFLAHKVMIPVLERIGAQIDPQARERSVREVLQARFEGREPDKDALDHIRYMPGAAVKEILTGARRGKR